MVGNWTLVAIDDIQRALFLSTYSFIIVIITTEASTFLSSGFLSLIWFQKWLIFWPFGFCSSSSCLCLYILSYIFPFTIFFYDVALKACNWVVFKLITHWYSSSRDENKNTYLVKSIKFAYTVMHAHRKMHSHPLTKNNMHTISKTDPGADAQVFN